MIKIETMGYLKASKYYLPMRFEDNQHLDFEEEDIECYSEITLYDFDKDLEENLSTGVKYFLLPIRSDGFGDFENKQFLIPGTKIISKIDELFQHGDESLIVTDYLTMFGLRLNRFKNYNSDFFKCDERVLFESLLMKNQYFETDSFFLSFPTIYKEVGIRKDRAVSIIKRFKELGFLESKIETDFINGQPSQITHYRLNCERIIELIPEIYLDEETSYEIKHDIEKYLKGNKAKIDKPKKPDDNINIMQ